MSHPCPIRTWHHTQREAQARADSVGGKVGYFKRYAGGALNWHCDWVSGETSAAPVVWEPPHLMEGSKE